MQHWPDLRQGNVLSLVLLKLALEKVVRDIPHPKEMEIIGPCIRPICWPMHMILLYKENKETMSKRMQES